MENKEKKIPLREETGFSSEESARLAANKGSKMRRVYFTFLKEVGKTGKPVWKITNKFSSKVRRK